jgi:hypothetical protein
MRGASLAIAVAAGLAGAWYGNLAITAGIALVLEHGRRLALGRVRDAS